MKRSIPVAIALLASLLIVDTAVAQTPKILQAQHFYYDDYEWPVPGEGTTTMTLTGMKSVHVVWLTFVRYTDGKPVDGPVITLLEGSKVKWAPQGGCTYELQLVNSNPPVINMNKPPAMCSLRPGAKAIFKVLAAP